MSSSSIQKGNSCFTVARSPMLKAVGEVGTETGIARGKFEAQSIRAILKDELIS